MIMRRKASKKVVVGISGGVDSAVALHLLKEKGFLPIGIFMKIGDQRAGFSQSEAEKRAEQICYDLQVPFYSLDVRKDFRKKVISYFLESYKKGDTPNPCIVCNQKIKFNFLFQQLKFLGGSYMATGHYGSIKDGKICVAVDPKKDQTYFLWNLNKKFLQKILLPLGEFKKHEVQKIAHQLNLSTVFTKESQEVCFIKDDLKSFLEDYIDLEPGKIENKEGDELGTHYGLPAYTIGQRKGIQLSGGPFYVLRKEIKRNVLVVTNDKTDLLQKKIFFREENFFETLDYPITLQAKIRYNGSLQKGSLISKNVFVFDKPQSAVTPGQSIVFYLDKCLVGGGIIK